MEVEGGMSNGEDVIASRQEVRQAEWPKIFGRGFRGCP